VGRKVPWNSKSESHLHVHSRLSVSWDICSICSYARSTLLQWQSYTKQQNTTGVYYTVAYVEFQKGRPHSPTIIRNSSEETANVNFFTTTSSTTFMQCAQEATKFLEITQSKSHYAIQGHHFGTNRKLIHNFLLVIVTYLLPCTVSEI